MADLRTKMRSVGVKLILDDAFAAKFKADPAAAAESMGITFTSEEIKEIKGRIETQGQGKLGSGVIPVVVWW